MSPWSDMNPCVSLKDYKLCVTTSRVKIIIWIQSKPTIFAFGASGNSIGACFARRTQICYRIMAITDTHKDRHLPLLITNCSNILDPNTALELRTFILNTISQPWDPSLIADVTPPLSCEYWGLISYGNKGIIYNISQNSWTHNVIL